MKKLFIFIVVLSAVGFSYVHFLSLPKLKSAIELQFKSAGFKSAEIEDIKYAIDGLSISKIYLDKEKFSNAENVKLKFTWPVFIFKSEIKSLSIQKLQIVTTTQEFLNEITTIKPRKLDSWPDTTIYNLIIDIATAKEPIRIVGKVQSKRMDETKNLEIVLNAAQDSLSFNSQITGSINADGNISVDSNFTDFKLDMYPAALSRGNGWISVQNENDGFDISAEINAGSGKIFEIPLQSISVTAGTQENSFPIIFRSNISGNQTTSLSADIELAQKIENQDFNIRFKSDDFQGLKTYLASQDIINIEKFSSLDFDKLLLEAQFLKERRFADGPWPFELSASNQNDKSASGVFLLYPDKFDLRGSAQGDAEMLNFMNQLIKGDETDGDTLRVDKNIKDYIFKN